LSTKARSAPRSSKRAAGSGLYRRRPHQRNAELLSRIYALDPDVILIDLENPSRDVLEQMFQVSRRGTPSHCDVRRPERLASIQASVDAGVSAYIVDGLKKERIKPILDLCISRFNAFSKTAGRARPRQIRA